MGYLMNVLQFVGVLAGAVAALIVAIGVILKSRLGTVLRWLWRRLVSEPVTTWFHREVALASKPVMEAVVDEKLLKRNGGTTVPDAIHKIDALRKDVRLMHEQNTARFEHIESQLPDAK